jgi:hypothetical protein
MLPGVHNAPDTITDFTLFADCLQGPDHGGKLHKIRASSGHQVYYFFHCELPSS